MDFLEANSSYDTASTVIMGIPLDSTVSYRPGTRFASQAIREASYGLESYSPILDRDLADYEINDIGDLELPFGNIEHSLALIRKNVKNLLEERKKILLIGGEHLITFPIMQEFFHVYPQCIIIHFDAHADLREQYQGVANSHACVIRRVVDLFPPSQLIQCGIRSGTKEEFTWMKKHQTLISLNHFEEKISKIPKETPVYITFDCDVFDPSILPGTGTPEPGGLFYQDFILILKTLKKYSLNIVGTDVVELSPHYDHSGVSAITAAKVIREFLLLL